MSEERKPLRTRPDIAELFDRYASGQAGVPECDPLQDADILLRDDAPQLRILRAYRMLSGCFNSHFLASIPYVLYGEIRLILSILRWHNMRPHARRSMWALGNAEGVMARCLAQITGGNLFTIVNSETAKNRDDFESSNTPESRFLLGSYFEVMDDINNILKERNLGGLAIVYQDTSFQMYSNQRLKQIQDVKRLLDKDGLYIALEKVILGANNKNSQAELKKEAMKKKFFSLSEIDAKRKKILSEMDLNLLSLVGSLSVLEQMFSYSSVIWNSCNFCMFLASDSEISFNQFIDSMPKNLVPTEYRFVQTTEPPHPDSLIA